MVCSFKSAATDARSLRADDANRYTGRSRRRGVWAMSVDPYAVPRAELLDAASRQPDVPDEVLKHIKNAWIAGAISGTLTLVVTLFAIFGQSILGFTAWELLDVALIFGLAFGIYRKSRTCAVIMLIYFIAAKIILMLQTGQPNGIVMGVIFAYYFAMGVKGTFEYQRILKAHR
jgi:hypothetical protein